MIHQRIAECGEIMRPEIGVVAPAVDQQSVAHVKRIVVNAISDFLPIHLIVKNGIDHMAIDGVVSLPSHIG
jgi:hypothetical protein